jgi:hypothetical protein
MKNLTYKDRLIIKASSRINRLMDERSQMVKNSANWQVKTRSIGQEKELIKDLRDGTANVDQHPEFKTASV